MSSYSLLRHLTADLPPGLRAKAKQKPAVWLLSYAKQYCQYGMEVAMLANKTDAAFFHVATETARGAAPIVVSVATWEKPLS